MRLEGLGKPEGCKLIRFTAEVEQGHIRTISIRGDFFASPEERFDRVEQGLSGTAVADLSRTFDLLMCREGIEAFGINGAGLARVVYAALDEEHSHG
ncbi:hypothetical protein LQZ21_02315 [Treponema sp. TIM-1]|uniref:hypothetical protein n=1 Tax=Treponema sp. TIM-1 TaxID=2898417 RepID=UPI00397FABBF